MTFSLKTAALLSPAALALASCTAAKDVDTADNVASASDVTFTTEEHGTFAEGWATAFIPGTQAMVITEKAGNLVLYDTRTKEKSEITGAPSVAYGGQGGLGDVAFVASETDGDIGSRTIYLSWAEAGDGDTYGAVVGRGTLNCSSVCAVEGLEIIWRQGPKMSKKGHYSHRLLISPDEQYLYVASGDRQEQTPAQDQTNTLGTIVRLNLDGTPAADNPWADKPTPTNQIWSWGHRNILGMDWDADGRLWEVEHGPAGGDELNLVTKSANYGWPTRSNGDNYNGKDIPDHTEDDGFVKPVLHWTPVIAPGDMLIYRGDMFDAWKGDALVAGLSSSALVHIDLEGETASEAARHEMGGRLRALAEGPDGALWVLEDGDQGRLLKLSL